MLHHGRRQSLTDGYYIAKTRDKQFKVRLNLLFMHGNASAPLNSFQKLEFMILVNIKRNLKWCALGQLFDARRKLLVGRKCISLRDQEIPQATKF